jgi:hypothetical protein
MIRLLGSMEGSEGEAARTLRQLILESWPWAEDDPDTEIHIITGVKCHGQTVRDLDLVVLGRFSARAFYTPFLSFSDFRDNTLKRPDTVHVQSFCLVIEVKDSDPGNVRFIGTQVEVRYGHRWKTVSEQNHKQVYALKNYLQHHRIAAPQITNLIWLRNVENADLPKRPHNILGGNATWELFINVIGQQSPPRFRNGQWVIEARFPNQPDPFQAISDLLTKAIQPTHLDRVKMDRICRAAINKGWIDLLGSKHLIFQGRGGTGKTVILLGLAWKAYEDRNARVLILTYNKALVADLRRLFTLMNLPDSLGENTIQIQTIHAFLYSILRGLGFDYEEESFLEKFEEHKELALSYIKEGAVASTDIKALVNGSDDFRWDFVFVDEAQDWPENERELLRCLYSENKFVIADGVDQLIRRKTPCDWRAGLTTQEVITVKLKNCLRMKAGLARFVNHLASALGLGQWNILPNLDAPGGRVIIIEGDYFANRESHEQLVRYNGADGNHPVDMLVCVPPSLVIRDSGGNVTGSAPAATFANWGQEVWDGTAEDIRTSYPTSVNQLRIIQYDSCRGLEGWVVINFGLDTFYEYKKSLWQPPAITEPGVFADDPALAHLFAARWVMIPMTRAIDTLVIQIDTGPSPIRDALAKAAAACSGFVVWTTARS